MHHDMNICALRQAYANGTMTPRSLFAELRQQAVDEAHRNIFILHFDDTILQPWLLALDELDPSDAPLWGIPFAVKDNIDIAGVPTTAGCEAFAYRPSESATVIKQLMAAGAIPIGKTNLDQFATGLNGTRSPYGACKNSVDPQYISGGSSAGSSVAVALGLASFSLGTDTAGSGRVPACFNNLIGLKPSRGLLSNHGVVPACKSLDCVSVFALNSDDASLVLQCAEGHDPSDGYSRQNPYHNRHEHYGHHQGALRIGVIPEAQLRFFGDDAYALAYAQTLEQLRATGATLTEVDYTPFDEAARLLYEGPWVTERYLATLPLIKDQPDAIFPAVRSIIEAGEAPLAMDLFSAEYRLHELKSVCLAQFDEIDCLLTPTAGRLFTIDEMLDEPLKRNSELGYYTNFVNLLDLSAVAVPTAFTDAGLPFGITLVGRAFEDRQLLSMANRIQQQIPLPMGASSRPQPTLSVKNVGITDTIDLAVCGAHLSGMPLNDQLRLRGATLKLSTTTASCYRLFALPGGPPWRPALIRDKRTGRAIDVEIWRVPTAQFGSFVAGIPAPLAIGKITLADDTVVSGFVCEEGGASEADEVIDFSSWKSYIASKGS